MFRQEDIIQNANQRRKVVNSYEIEPEQDEEILEDERIPLALGDEDEEIQPLREVDEYMVDEDHDDIEV